jgi:hypothetical protein
MTLRKDFIIALALLAVGPCPSRATADEVPRTLRVDYIHTGGKGLEVISLDRVVLEPLPFPGHSVQVSDDPSSGNYRYEVRSPQGKLIYSRGFSSIFAEWVLTAEAGNVHRSFHESLRFPAPTEPVQVTVLRRNERQSFDPVWTALIDPADPFVDDAPTNRQQLISIQNTGSPTGKVDLLLIGDGYTAAECSSRFEPQARKLAQALFDKEPFKSRRDDFNVWGLCPPSATSGISRPSTGQHRRTPVGATYDAFGSERYILTFDNKALREIAAWAPYEFLAILANNETYGGGGIHNAFATVAAGSEWAEYIFVHELGHHIASLADEYYTSPVAYEPAETVVEPWEPNVTALKTPDRLKWRDLVAADTPIPTAWPKQPFEERQRDFQARRKKIRDDNLPESEMNALFREEQAYTTGLLRDTGQAGRVGAYQGANYDSQAFYRPQIDCVMFTRDEVPFCKVCQSALEKVIDLYTATGE